jgi:hypothetical protein
LVHQEERNNRNGCISIFLREEEKMQGVRERGQERHVATNIRAWHERLE